MALIYCSQCGKPISDSATHCIHCGSPVAGVTEPCPAAFAGNQPSYVGEATGNTKKPIIILLAFLIPVIGLFLFLFFANLGSSDKSDSPVYSATLVSQAEHGNAQAQFDLGECYANGSGMAQDNTEAVRWFRKAAEQGHAKAQVQLGECYLRGDGVAKNHAEGVRWLRKAAERGHEGAQRALKELF
ncbi:MAG: SEL1-like repeat protein [Muribaculaceae bacterium]|nr:SEL1-like repeat protein [Muribaculaceae bacterium]